jgi:hypothetical protein
LAITLDVAQKSNNKNQALAWQFWLFSPVATMYHQLLWINHFDNSVRIIYTQFIAFEWYQNDLTTHHHYQVGRYAI